MNLVVWAEGNGVARVVRIAGCVSGGCRFPPAGLGE